MPSYDNPRDRPPELAHRVVSQPILERSASSTLLEDQSMSKWNKNQGPGNVGDGSGQDVPHDTEAGVIDGENVPVHQNNGKQSYASITSNLNVSSYGNYPTTSFFDMEVVILEEDVIVNWIARFPLFNSRIGSMIKWTRICPVDIHEPGNLGAATSGAKDHRARASLPKGLMNRVKNDSPLSNLDSTHGGGHVDTILVYPDAMSFDFESHLGDDIDIIDHVEDVGLGNQ
ncbi:hypothetical protein V6N11_018247 [Hibiscus sabdariffa]|uniref:Uncharacterized protein n=1 Tax=Hibiscus sabdariffa TaxID=183260 RepID=A0ABR2T6U5_9ROSI